MIFSEIGLKGAYVIELEKQRDERGFFARSWCRREFKARGLETGLSQCNISFNAKKGTLRGMHYQAEPFGQAKLVRCTSGSIYDVIVDLRPGSPSLHRHAGIYLTSSGHTMLFVPKGFAHGFLTLEDDTEVFYQMSDFHAPGYECGFRWDDPFFGIEWPPEVRVICERDRGYQDFAILQE